MAKTRQNLNLESMKCDRGKSKMNVLAVATHRNMTTVLWNRFSKSSNETEKSAGSQCSTHAKRLGFTLKGNTTIHYPKSTVCRGDGPIVFLTPDLDSDAGRARYPQHLCCLTIWPSLLGDFSVCTGALPSVFLCHDISCFEYRKLPEVHESHEQKSSNSTTQLALGMNWEEKDRPIAKERVISHNSRHQQAV